jgi:hypothetical protein
MNILQILPRVPPAVCGIGDYGWLLARELRDVHDIHSSFLSAGTHWTKPEENTEFPVFRLPAFTAEALADFIATRTGEFQAIILHMSPYGYHKRGVPLWLAHGWRRLSQLPRCPRLLTMFHELYASGPVTSSAFWLQPLQKQVLRQIARASDGLRTNREAYADWLRQVPGLKSSEVPAFPVFSNLGESSPDSGSPERWNAMTVFASTIRSGQESLLADFCRGFGIERLGWIGAQPPPALHSTMHVRHVSHLPSQDAASWFGEHGFAFTGYSPEFLAKSGIFAAYAAHRMAVVLPEAPAELPDRLGRGREFLIVNEANVGEEPRIRAERIAARLHQWYQPHNLRSTAASYAEQLSS